MRPAKVTHQHFYCVNLDKNFVELLTPIYINKIACMYVCLYVHYRKEDGGLQKKIKTTISREVFS